MSEEPVEGDFSSIESPAFCNILEALGFDFFVGVPCSTFKPLYGKLQSHSHWTYIPAVREDAAVGIAVGAYMAGRKPVVLMQNSGFGYSLNAFTSLALIYEIPLLVLIGWRGYQGQDAPEHIVMGLSLLDILSDVGISCTVLGTGDIEQELTQGARELERTKKPVAILVRRGVMV
ncbi:MAG: thiamine pyrophosphate-binding protein [Acidobacteriota bacterium]|nr:thiamine pyrophosphate-binding protein [Acidobacteriota bacterium]